MAVISLYREEIRLLSQNEVVEEYIFWGEKVFMVRNAVKNGQLDVRLLPVENEGLLTCNFTS